MRLFLTLLLCGSQAACSDPLDAIPSTPRVSQDVLVAYFTHANLPMHSAALQEWASGFDPDAVGIAQVYCVVPLSPDRSARFTAAFEIAEEQRDRRPYIIEQANFSVFYADGRRLTFGGRYEALDGDGDLRTLRREAFEDLWDLVDSHAAEVGCP